MTASKSTRDLFEVHFFTNVNYVDSMKLQAQFLEKVLTYHKNFILSFEYPPTITLGKRSVNAGHVLSSLSPDGRCADNSLNIVESERGGEATLHSPGQLVIYPLLSLRDWNLSVRSYVRLLESATQRFFAKFQIPTVFHDGDSGIYLETGEKVAFIGLKIQKNITSHGIAINISNELHLFDQIISCGVRNRPVQSLQQLGHRIDLEKALRLWIDGFLLELPKMNVSN